MPAECNQHLAILRRLVTTSGLPSEVNATLDRTLAAITEITGHEMSSLHLLSADGRRLDLYGDRGLSAPLRKVNKVLATGDGLIGRVALSGKPVRLERVARSPYLLPAARDVVRAAGIRGFICVPIGTPPSVLGTLSLGRRTRDPFTADDVRLLEVAAAHIAIVLEAARRQAETQRRLGALEEAQAGSVDDEAILDSVPDGLFFVSREGVILRANEAAAKILQADRTSLPGRSLQETFFKASFISSLIAEVLTKRTEVMRTHRINGHKLLVSAKPVAPRTDKVVVIVRDVTGLGQLVSQLQTAIGPLGSDWADMRGAESRGDETTALVTSSRVLQAVRERALSYAPVNSPVLLLGETGTGKNVFARLIHDASPRGDGPFHVVNCGAIPEGLLEAQLFGYAKGAFTGADSRGRLGVINLAHTGTLVLDEIGDLPWGLQVKLLRFLEAGEVWPVGGTEAKHPDVRILAATNRDLGTMMAEGTFRKDLFYRLHILVLTIPPLREHPEDIPELVQMMMDRLARRLGLRKALTPEAMEALRRYAFPGNVRELWNIIESRVVTVKGDTIDASDLPSEVVGSGAASTPVVLTPEGLNLRQALRQLETQLLREALRRYGTQSKAARHLGVAQATVARKTQQYGIRH